MGLKLPTAGEVTLMRALAGGAYELYPGRTIAPILRQSQTASYRRRNNAKSSENVSQFLLGELDLTGKEIAFDVNGKKRP